VADIFISYSKVDRDLASKISAFLEAEGWTVWWDKSLTAGDSYRDEIMRQLAAARAVITVWTESSIRSDWVRAEAGRAKADVVKRKSGFGAIRSASDRFHTAWDQPGAANVDELQRISSRAVTLTWFGRGG
jgi:hypothetical protein